MKVDGELLPMESGPYYNKHVALPLQKGHALVRHDLDQCQFLHIQDLHAQYLVHLARLEPNQVGWETPYTRHSERANSQDAFW